MLTTLLGEGAGAAPSRRKQAVVWALGAILVAAGQLIAPVDWTGGPGRLRVGYRGEIVVMTGS